MAGIPGVGGHNKKSIEELKKTGSYRPSRHDHRPEFAENLYDFQDGMPEPPDEIKNLDHVLGHWHYLHNTVPQGVLKQADLSVLTSYCLMTAQLLDSAATSTPLPASWYPPFLAILRELGLTPLARMKLRKDISKDEPSKNKSPGFEDLN